MSLSDGEAISSFMSAGSVRIYFLMHTLMFIVPKWKTTSLRSRLKDLAGAIDATLM